MRFIRLFTFLILIVGFITLFQAIRLYRTPSIVVEWSTASELDVAGFNILRANNPDGPYTPINPTLISPSVDSLKGGDYAYMDTKVEGGDIYFYQLQEVSLSGTTAVHGPIEAQATRGGLIEAILAGILIVSALLLLSNKRQK